METRVVGTALQDVPPYPTPSSLFHCCTIYGEVSLQRDCQNLDGLFYRHPSIDVRAVQLGKGCG
jgi:hypothetical protein